MHAYLVRFGHGTGYFGNEVNCFIAAFWVHIHNGQFATLSGQLNGYFPAKAITCTSHLQTEQSRKIAVNFMQ